MMEYRVDEMTVPADGKDALEAVLNERAAEGYRLAFIRHQESNSASGFSLPVASWRATLVFERERGHPA